MFSFRRRESPRLELYGKLPLAKDYLRIGCGAGTGLALREWLDQGFSGTAESQPVLARPLCFVAATESAEPVQGCLWPSSDAGGLRRFPLAILVERRRKALLSDLAAGLDQACGVWSRLREVHSTCRAQADGQALLTSLRGVELDLDDVAPQTPERFALEDWLSALWPGEGTAGLLGTLEALGAPALQSERECLRLPLAVDLPLRDQVHGWLWILERAGLVRAADLPTFFYPMEPDGEQDGLEPASDEPACLFVARSALAPAHARWLTSAREGSLGPGDLCAGTARRAGPRTPAPEGGSALAPSLRGILAGFRGRSPAR